MTTDEEIELLALQMCMDTGIRYIECLFVVTTYFNVNPSQEFMQCLYKEYLNYQTKMKAANLETKLICEDQAAYVYRFYTTYILKDS